MSVKILLQDMRMIRIRYSPTGHWSEECFWSSERWAPAECSATASLSPHSADSRSTLLWSEKIFSNVAKTKNINHSPLDFQFLNFQWISVRHILGCRGCESYLSNKTCSTLSTILWSHEFTCWDARNELEGEAQLSTALIWSITEVFLESPAELSSTEPGLEVGSLGGRGGGFSATFINDYHQSLTLITGSWWGWSGDDECWCEYWLCWAAEWVTQ